MPEPTIGTAPAKEHIPTALDALRLSNFRYLWSANFLYFSALQMQVVAMQWLLLDLTGSRALLGLIATVQALVVVLLSPWGGLIAERSPRRRLLILGRAGLAVITTTLGVLVATGLMEIPYLFAAAVVMGLFVAVTQPATQTFLFDVVGGRFITAAVSLNSTATSLSFMAGPAVGAAFISIAGVGGAYIATSGALLAGIGLMLLIPIAGRTEGLEKKSPLADLLDGARFILKTPLMLWVFVIISLNVFGAFLPLLRPVYAKEVLKVGVEGLGFMGLAFGAGSVTSAIAVTLLANVKRKGYMLLFASMVWDLSMIGYGLSTSFTFTLFCEFLAGTVAPLFFASTMTMLQTSAPAHMRSRVMSVFFMVQQTVFFGQFLGGFLADRLGDRLPLFIGAGARELVLISALLFAASLKNFGRESYPQAAQPLSIGR